MTILGQVAYLLAPRGRRSGFVEMVVDFVARTRREARAGNGAAAWRAAAGAARTGMSLDVPAYRQLSRRTEASLFASHPPSGLRAGLIAGRAAQPAAVVMTEAEQARMDDELATHYERVRRELVTT
ncbi:hypothetical protein [Actinoplanes ianthinogenes]|uniref:hypothetical protein n=1 Tax=Actinoplanes ianthinogenes TaxID=122358 RepID=UPI0016710F67|nr:hypothetical protein [Actinoplanes ianthinogenes]